MKVQYFGDKHDFFKYRLLLRLGNAGFQIGHFWMLTPPDGRDDGNHDISDQDIQNLQPEEIRLLEFLRSHRGDRDHGFRGLQSSGLLPGVSFFDEELPAHGGRERNALIQRCLRSFEDRDVVFFDPDNGLENGREEPENYYRQRISSKYVFLNELKSFFDLGKTLMIYQHKPFQALDNVVATKTALLRRYFPEQNIFFVQHTRVFFIFVVQSHHKVINEKFFETLIVEKKGKVQTANKLGQKIRCPHCSEIINISVSAENS